MGQAGSVFRTLAHNTALQIANLDIAFRTIRIVQNFHADARCIFLNAQGMNNLSPDYQRPLYLPDKIHKDCKSVAKKRQFITITTLQTLSIRRVPPHNNNLRFRKKRKRRLYAVPQQENSRLKLLSLFCSATSGLCRIFLTAAARITFACTGTFFCAFCVFSNRGNNCCVFSFSRSLRLIATTRSKRNCNENTGKENQLFHFDKEFNSLIILMCIF